MRLRILLFSIFFAGILNAQIVCDYPEGVITDLVITEARFTSANDAYVEITNMGSQPIRLSEFKYGTLTPYSSTWVIKDMCNDPWYTTVFIYMFLPDRLLDPGKSFVLTTAYDYNPVHFKEGAGQLGGAERMKQTGIYEVADKILHRAEPIYGVNYERDSVTTAFNDPETLRKRGDYSYLFSILKGGTMYLEHHYTEGDSTVVDQVGGVFDGGGRNRAEIEYPIAGVERGMMTSILVRKFHVKKGNIDFANARGISRDDSEWIPIELPEGYDYWRDIFWTIGNHGDYVIDETTLEPLIDGISVDFAAKKITVPWGIRRLDDIMRHMKKKPGLAWKYDLNPLKEDSLYRSIRTGDKLTLYAVGNTLTEATFELEVTAPTADDNIVIPVDHPIIRIPGLTGPVTTRTQSGILGWPRVTKHSSGTDTITGYGFGLESGLRTDSLLKYLEKPAEAGWEFVWVDGVTRADLLDGDKLKVTSKSGKVKEYFIQVKPYFPSTNTDLSSITWPEIPEFYRGMFGWKGDTIPNFASGTTNYRVAVPFDVEGIPGLIAKTSHVNATVKVTRAKSLSGSLQDRTVLFEVTAEADSLKKTYQVELVKEKMPNEVEPFHAEPIISEFVNAYPLGNTFLEIYNPGNQPIDLRNYLVGRLYQKNADNYWPITQKPSIWDYRYLTYTPGLKYVDKATWSLKPEFMAPDPNVKSILQGGETFVLGATVRGNDYYPGIVDYFPPWDVQFTNFYLEGIGNPWNEYVRVIYTPFPRSNDGAGWVLYKVLTDSIKNGLKGVTDPYDFEIIDIWGMPDGGLWKVGDYAVKNGETGNVFIRKPTVNKGNPVRGGSFGSDEATSEWIRIAPNTDFKHIGVPARYGAVYGSLNQHFMIEPTYYKSTVNSSVYKVSSGYGPNQEILGLKAGITVSEFLSNINKEDEGQVLTMKTAADGSVPASDALINKNDRLEVVSADGQNSTTYRLDVTEAGLSNNAYLTSTRWKVEVAVDPKSGAVQSEGNEGVGSISGFDYGTTIKAIIDNVKVPAGATLTIVDGNGAYISSTKLNFDTAYVSVTVNPDIYLDVVAEDNITRIIYQLQPSTSEGDAFILSDVYEVSQLDNLIHFVPRGTNFQAFLSNIIPSLGATIKLVDKMGFERTEGIIRADDKVVVTSANGLNTRIYFISFLATITIPQTTYLAYVLSDAYSINQVGYEIAAGLAPLTSETLLSEFLGYITPSMGAAISVVDKDGNVKTTGDLNDGDKLLVTSADGKITTTYTLALDLTSAGSVGLSHQIEIFPNPASDKLNIQGVKAGNRIQIYSANGALIHEVKAQSSLEIIPLDQVPTGMFMIVVSDNQNVLGRYKAIRK